MCHHLEENKEYNRDHLMLAQQKNHPFFHIGEKSKDTFNIIINGFDRHLLFFSLFFSLFFGLNDGEKRYSRSSQHD